VAEIVGAIGLPHNPFTALQLHRGATGAEQSRRLYDVLAGHLAAMAADTLIVVTTDHYNLFFDLSVPIFAIGVAERAAGPCDFAQHPQYDVPIDEALAVAIQAAVVADEFDLGRSQEFELDHTIVAPLSLILPAMDVPLVPVWVSGSMRPLPSARRCFALGAAIRRAVESSELARRVVVVGSGAFSYEVGGPRMSETSHVGVPDPAWAAHATELIGRGSFAELVAQTTEQQLVAAGNASGELLDWIVMLGTFDARPPAFIEAQLDEGHAFAAWSLA
jgi:aromatic ring-opening dioxygenase catalytic subunit (LigB family)